MKNLPFRKQEAGNNKQELTDTKQKAKRAAHKTLVGVNFFCYSLRFKAFLISSITLSSFSFCNPSFKISPVSS